VNLHGKVRFAGREHRLETDRLTVLDFRSANETDRENPFPHFVVSGTLNLTTGNTTATYIFNATNPEELSQQEVTARVGNEIVMQFEAVR